jgi:hypothetical protein
MVKKIECFGKTVFGTIVALDKNDVFIYHFKKMEYSMTTETLGREKVSQRAYQMYVERGNKPGSDLDDWLKAEKEIVGQDKKKKLPPISKTKEPARMRSQH